MKTQGMWRCAAAVAGAVTITGCGAGADGRGDGGGGGGYSARHDTGASGTASGGMPPSAGCGPLAPYPDPSREGQFKVGTTSYAAGQLSMGSPSVSVGRRAAVFYPARAAGQDAPVAEGGPFPVAVIVHGNHPIYRDYDGNVVNCDETFVGGASPHLKTLDEIRITYPDAERVQSHLGYAYLAANLASAGVVTVSIDASDVSCIGSATGFVPERAQLVREHILALREGNADAHLRALRGHLDLSRLVYIGHSRGGEAVLEASRSAPVAGTTVKGVIAVAPTDILFDGRVRQVDAPLLVVLPAADGDVSFNGGMRYYDVTAPRGDADASWFKAQAYVYGANHNFFNSEWREPLYGCDGVSPDGDNGQGNGDVRLTRAQQERYLVSAVRTFLDAILNGSGAARTALSGIAAVEGLGGVFVRSSFAEAAVPVPLQNSPEHTGFSTFGRYPFHYAPDAYNDSFFQFTEGYVGTWDSPGAELSLPVTASPDAPGYVAFRVAQVVDERNRQGRGMAVDVELEDGSGHHVRAPSDWTGSEIPAWYERPPWADPFEGCDRVRIEKTVLETAQIPATCFQGDAGFSFKDVKTLRLRPRVDGGGAIAITDVTLGGP